MTRPQKHFAFLGSALIACTAAPVFGQDVIGFDDFDTSVAGQDYLNRSFTPDHSKNTGFGSPSPTFGDSGFDLFGIGGRNGGNNGLPFDVLDDSTGGFPDDELGFIGTGPNDPGNVVLVADTVNPDNPDPGGLVSASWQFDISGASNLQFSTDMVGLGNFTPNDDSYLFTAQIDGGPAQTLFDVKLNEVDGNGETTYELVMDSGTRVDRIPSPFFDEGDWNTLTQFGPVDELDYHPADDDQDGFIDTKFHNEGNPQVEDMRALSSGEFTDEEFIPLADPLFVNGTSQTGGTQLDGEFQTLTAPVSGTGDTLTINFQAVSNGSFQYFSFDNLLLEGDLPSDVVLGDLTGDDVVDGLDIDPFVQALTGGDFDPAADLDGNDVVDGLDIDPFVQLLTGSGDATLASVPEPGTLALLGMGGLTLLRRRRA